jgi:hypothetical protein
MRGILIKSNDSFFIFNIIIYDKNLIKYQEVQEDVNDKVIFIFVNSYVMLNIIIHE